MAYLSLFGMAFLAATILPAYSEILLIKLQNDGYPVIWLWFWATLGNTLGSAVNWLLGRYCLHFQDRRWFPFKKNKLAKTQAWFQKYGVWTLLLAWAPIGGDALTFIAGVMRVKFWLFFLLTMIGKGARYAAVLGIIHWLF